MARWPFSTNKSLTLVLVIALSVGFNLPLQALASVGDDEVAETPTEEAAPSEEAEAAAQSDEPAEEPAEDEAPTEEPAPEEAPVEEPAAEEEPDEPAGPQVTVLVTLANGADAEAVLERHGATEVDSVDALGLHIVEIAEGAVADLRDDDDVVAVDRDRERAVEGAPSDPAYDSQWALPQIGWDTVYGEVTPSGQATIAVLDTGVDAGADVDLVNGFSAVDGGNATSDSHGHGTAMAQIAAAKSNDRGIAGVAFDGVSVMPVKVLGDDGAGTDSDIIEGVVHAADNGADVILMAFSNPGYSHALQAAVDYAWSKGAVLVAATGNDGSTTVTYPAGTAKVMGVTGTTKNDQLWSGANYGAAAFIGAPAVDIADGNGSTTGTSASAAIVAGSAALLAADSDASNGVIVGRLARNADEAEGAGNGRLNLERTLADDSTEAVVPAGSVNGGSGPVVGPYTAAANQFNVTPASQSVGAGATQSYTWTFTAANSGWAAASHSPCPLVGRHPGLAVRRTRDS